MTYSVQTVIHAAPEAIWGILTDAREYAAWNTTVDRVDGRIASGETVTVHAKISPGRSFPVQVVTFDAPHRMVWSSGMPLGLFKGERTFELHASGANSVTFSMSETYTGLMAPIITKSIPNLQPAFDEFAACLKARAERPNE